MKADGYIELENSCKNPLDLGIEISNSALKNIMTNIANTSV